MTFRTTSIGRLAALFVIAVGFAAVNTGNNLLYLLLSLLVAAFAVSLAAATWSLRRLDVELVALPPAARGSTAPVTVRLHRRGGRWPLLGLELAARADGLPAAPSTLDAIEAGSRVTLVLPQPAPTRGVHPLAAVELATYQPLGLLRASRRAPVAAELVVHPRPGSALPPRAGTPGHGAAAPSLRRGAGDDLVGLRPATAQDELRRIDWKASARAERLMAREHAAEEGQALLVDVAARHPDEPQQHFEERLDRSASLAVAGLRAGLAVGLRGAAGAVPAGIGAAHRQRLLRALAGAPPLPPAEES